MDTNSFHEQQVFLGCLLFLCWGSENAEWGWSSSFGWRDTDTLPLSSSSCPKVQKPACLLTTFQSSTLAIVPFLGFLVVHSRSTGETGLLSLLWSVIPSSHKFWYVLHLFIFSSMFFFSFLWDFFFDPWLVRSVSLNLQVFGYFTVASLLLISKNLILLQSENTPCIVSILLKLCCCYCCF